MPDTRRAGGLAAIGLFLSWLALHAGTAEAFIAPDSADRVLLLGREGWVHEAWEEEGLLRVPLSEPGSEPGRSSGLMVLECDRRGYRLHFSLGRLMRQRVRGGGADGFVHFIAGRANRGAASHVTFYVDFRDSSSFRSRSSLIIARTGSVPDLIELLRTAGRTATLVLSPRASGRAFALPQRILLVLEPGGDILPMDEALAAFREDCQRRG